MKRAWWVVLCSGCGLFEGSRPELPAAASAPDGAAPPRIAPGLAELPERYRCDQPGAGLECFDFVPAATFTMGAQASDPGGPAYDPLAMPEEGPPRQVQVSGFWIQRYELNATAYGHCVHDKWCSEDQVLTEGPLANYGRPERREHPINGVTWQGAVDVCRYFSSRLPTEAEWELAARGVDGRRWPWGNEPGCGTGSTNETAKWSMEVKVGECNHTGTMLPRELRGDGPYGTTGLAGNVTEWVLDWYSPDAYGSGGSTDPRGPDDGAARVQRGGGWTEEDPANLRTTARYAMPPDGRLPDVGLRCVWIPTG